jgi:hypothetical protein
MHCPVGNNRFFCLGFIGLGVLLILLGMAQVSEAGQTTPQPATPAEISLPTDICDVCHEDDVAVFDPSVEQSLQRTAMDVLIFQRDHVLTTLHREQVYYVQHLLSSAQRSLLDGDSETAQSLIQHANQMIDNLERQARLSEQVASAFYAHVGILNQQETFLGNMDQTSRLTDVEEGQRWIASVLEELPLSQLMAASMHRRAPPDEDASFAYIISYRAKPGDLLSNVMAVSFFVARSQVKGGAYSREATVSVY